MRDFDGKYDSEELMFDNDILFLIPPDKDLRPSNIIMFEVIMLASETSNIDKVVGWGAFPLLNSDF
jgi:hypothetical protein